MLTIDKDGVTILNQKNEKNTRAAYDNSLSGRAALTAEQSSEIVAEVMVVWGDTPTIPDYVPEPMPEQPEAPRVPSLEQRTAALESAMLTMLGGGVNV